MYYLFIDYFDVDRISDIDGLNYPAGSLVAFVQQGADPANLSFVASSVFSSAKSVECSLDILDNSVSHVLNVDSTPPVGFSIRFDLPYQLFITSSAFSFLYSFYASDFGGGSTVDITPILDGISTLQNQLNTLSFPQLDLTPVLTKLDNLSFLDAGGFSLPDLDGNFGAYSNGSVVTVSGRSGEYVIEASQQLWSFPASDFQGSCVIYKLSQNGKILLAPHWMLSLKVL